MSIDLFEATVCPRIPAKCLADIESWLLFRVFRANRKDEYIGFDGCWDLNDLFDGKLFPDKELEKALSNSRQVCPELCAAVERQLSKEGWILLGAVNYHVILHGIILRHEKLLDCISIEEQSSDTKYRYFDKGFSLITATEIGSIYIEGGKIVHRIRSWEREPGYIMSSAEYWGRGQVE